MRCLGIDPGLTCTGWACLEIKQFISCGSVHHGFKGGGNWQAKIDMIVRQAEEQVRAMKPDRIVIEKPAYHAWGGKPGSGLVANATALLATLDCAWSIAWALRDLEPVFMRPDRLSKNKRTRFLTNMVHDWPKRSNEHVRDAGWLALRGMGLA